MKIRITLIGLLLLLGIRSASAYPLTPLLEYCLEPHQPVLLQALGPIENGIFFVAYTGANSELIQAYVSDITDWVDFYVDSQPITCRFPQSEGDLPSITLYPLGGTRWTWAVQDDFQNWHTVRLLTGDIVQTPPEYDSDGRLITRLVVRRNQPLDPARYRIFDENGQIAG